MNESKQEKGLVKIQAEFDMLNIHFTYVLDHLDKLVSRIEPRLVELQSVIMSVPEPSLDKPSIMAESSVMVALNSRLEFYRRNLAKLDEIVQHLDTLV